MRCCHIIINLDYNIVVDISPLHTCVVIDIIK